MSKEPANPYEGIVVKVVRGNLFTDTTVGVTLPNPLETQQSVGLALHLDQKTRDQIKNLGFEQIANAPRKNLEHIFCGPAALATCINSLIIDDSEYKSGDMWPDGYLPVRLLAEMMIENGKPCHDPQTGEEYPDGWQVFAIGDPKNILTWDIRHQALAYAATLNDRAESTGIHNFQLSDLVPFLQSGGKAVVSVDNQIIQPKQVDKWDHQPGAGTHLIAIIGASADGEYLMVGDPYWSNYDKTLTSHQPRWMEISALQSLMSGDGKGIALEKKGADMIKKLPDITYPFVVPGK